MVKTMVSGEDSPTKTNPKEMWQRQVRAFPNQLRTNLSDDWLDLRNVERFRPVNLPA